MAFLTIDLGTTHCKAAVMHLDGGMVSSRSIPTVTERDAAGAYFYDPEKLWMRVLYLLIITCGEVSEGIHAIGITGMAEAGLFVHHRTGEPLTAIIPWFDMRTESLYLQMQGDMDRYERFRRTGLHNHYKYSVYKMKWLLDNEIEAGGESAVARSDLLWLSLPDFIAYRLTSVAATDSSLAARTYLFDINTGEWIEEYIAAAGISGIQLPEVRQSGSIIGTVDSSVYRQDSLIAAARHGYSERVPDLTGAAVTIAGHDHLCAALAAGVIENDILFDSLGTAESLLAVAESGRLGRDEVASGFSFGPHVLENRFCWLGSVAASGDSVEWIRSVLSCRRAGKEREKLYEQGELGYDEMMGLLEQAPAGPTGIFYLPYLTGSNAPIIDPNMSAAFIGLKKSHGTAALLKAVLEGISYEFEWIRREAAAHVHLDTDVIRCVGGGTRNTHLMQLKADMTNCTIEVLQHAEAGLLGAMWVSALYGTNECTLDDIMRLQQEMMKRERPAIYSPDPERSSRYALLFSGGYRALQEPFRSLVTELYRGTR